MLRYSSGTVFNVKAEAIVNPINCTGVMGAGLALEFKLRYPTMFLDHKKKVDQGRISLGQVDYFLDPSGVTIVNFPTKDHYKDRSRLEWIDEGLEYFVHSHQTEKFKSIAFPKLGTGYGGLDWLQVKRIMEKHLQELDLDVVICLDDLEQAQGVESKMLSFLADIPFLGREIGLSIQQVKNIQNNLPLNRFASLLRIPSIGPRAYERIFLYLYRLAAELPSDQGIQGKLFE